MTLADSMLKAKVERKKAQEFKQEKEREMHQDLMGLLRQQTEMLWTLVDLCARVLCWPPSAAYRQLNVWTSLHLPSTFHMASRATALPLQLHPGEH